MKPMTVKTILIPVGAVLLALSAGRGIGAPAVEQWLPSSNRIASDTFEVGNRDMQLNFNALLLTLGRSVYEDLQRARQAALNKRSTNLVVSLREARDAVDRLLLPSQARALEAQLRIIRNDIGDHSKRLDADLWAPVEAEIDDALAYEPEAVRTGVHAAVGKGQAAATADDRAEAEKQLEVVTSSLEFNLGIFPVHAVDRDLASALTSATLPKPDMNGALEAVQSALAKFHWYTRESARGLLAAYNDVINAYVLATGPAFRADRRQQSIDYLSRAERDLGKVPDNVALVAEVHKLIDQVEPKSDELKHLLRDIRSRIGDERRRSAAQYLSSVVVH